MWLLYPFCDAIICPGCLGVGSPYSEWLSSVSVLLPVVLQWDVIVLDDCVPDVFVINSFRGCLFCMSVCIMYVCRIYILDVCVFVDCLAVVGVRHLCVFNAQIWNVCLQNVFDQYLFGEWLCGFYIVFVIGSFVLDASVRDLRMLNGWDQFVCLQDFCAGWMFIG